jgi:hypothetical protein
LKTEEIRMTNPLKEFAEALESLEGQVKAIPERAVRAAKIAMCEEMSAVLSARAAALREEEAEASAPKGERG